LCSNLKICRANLAYYSQGKLFLGWSDLDPVPELNVENGDLVIFFLSANGIKFSRETRDPWYEATHNAGAQLLLISAEDLNQTITMPLYGANNPASPLGCKTQHQFCTSGQPAGSQCAPLSPYLDFIETALVTFLANQEVANRRINWLYDAILSVAPVLPDIPAALGSHSLLSRQGLSANIQGPLPDNQWMLDIQHWHNITLASLQDSFVVAVTGPSDPAVLPWMNRKPNNTEEQYLCNNQVSIEAVSKQLMR
jgi:hypothetical protein